MTPAELDVLYADTDVTAKLLLKKHEAKPPCCKGCFHCCREPVYASSTEVEAILDMLTPEQKDDLSVKVLAWRDLYLASGFQSEKDVEACHYRTKRMWCPLLNVDGTCSVYHRRPFGCRLHFAKDTPDGCEHDELREHQQFWYMPEISGRINAVLWDKMRDGDHMFYDHLGLLLYEALYKEKTDTVSRLEVEVRGEDLIVHKYAE